MKITLRIPLDQFAYAEYTGDYLSFEDALAEYHRNIKQFRGGEGLGEQEMDVFIENMLLGNNKNHLDQYEKASKTQQVEIQRIKRAVKRLKARAK